jgi:hypothetical protein
VSFAYKPAGSGDVVRRMVRHSLEGAKTIRDGRYGGSCATAAGRQTARRRACDAVVAAMEETYANNVAAIRRLVCEGNEGYLAALREAEWVSAEKAEIWARAYATTDEGSRIIAHDKRRDIAMDRTHFSCAPPPPYNEQNTDRPGGDYTHHESAAWEECANACLADSRCNAWTWVKPGVQGPRGMCWLKDSVPARRPNNCCVSGYR